MMKTFFKKSCFSFTMLLLWLASCWTFASKAQVPEDPIIAKSPNAASLGLFGDVPVSQFTGLPSIEIPIYTVQEGKIALPISLSYHASGVRPDMHPGWVGMGWNLQAGGIISRAVNDQPDELDRPNSNCPKCGIYYYPATLNNPDWDKKPSIQTIAGGKYSNITFNSLNNNHQDSEPDEFNFSVSGYTGKFYLDVDGTYKVQCDKPVKVTLNVNQPLIAVPFTPPPQTTVERYGYFPSFSGFTITVEDGTQYVFGGATDAIEYSLNFFAQDNDYWVASSWYLTQIIHPQGYAVSLKYGRDQSKFVNQMYTSVYDQINLSLIDGSNLKSQCSSYTNGVYQVYNSFAGKLVAPVYLSQITSTNSVVLFDHTPSRELQYATYAYDAHYYSNQPAPFLPIISSGILRYPQSLSNLEWQKLNQIRVSDSFNRPIKSFAFGYSDNPANPNRDKERLTLLSVTEQGVDGLNKPPYRFAYQNYQSLPGYLALQSDHWGFFNNCARYANMNPQVAQISYQTHYADREPSTDPAVYLCGMLTSITYPTGGTTKFEYSQHTYSQQLAELRSSLQTASSSRQVAGGVRIRRITSWSADKPTQKTQKTYYYINSASIADTTSAASSGILGGKTRYYFDDYKVAAYNDPNRVYTKAVFSTQSVLPACSNSHGSHIGYSQVIEKSSDEGYKVSSFTNFDNGHFDDVAGPNNTLEISRISYEPYSSNEEQRGRLFKERIYNTAGQVVKLHEIDYSKVADEFVRAVKASTYAACVSVADARIGEGTAYRFYTYSYFPSQEREITYDVQGLNGVATTKNYLYDDYTHRLVKSITETDSKGLAVETHYKYPLDFAYGSATPTDPTAKGIALMRGPLHMVGLPIETTRLRNGNFIWATVALYAEFLPNQVLPSQVLELNSAQPLAQQQYTPPFFSDMTPGARFTFDPSLTPTSSFSGYDSRGNPGSITTRGVLTTSYLWGYNNTLPVAKVENANSAEVFCSNFEEDKVTSTARPDAPNTWYSPGNYLRFEASPSDRPSVRNAAHTGQLAAAMYTTYQGEQGQAFGPTLTIPGRAKRFVVSGWVYSNGPAAQIWLFMNQSSARHADGTIGYYDYSNNNLTPVNLSTNVTGQWVYLEQEVDVPANATLLTLRLTNFWNGAGNAAASVNGGGVWYDDVRVHPADAQMTTYTHLPSVGVTSVSDANNRPVYYEYDGLNRLWVARDQNRNIIKQYQYHYQR